MKILYYTDQVYMHGGIERVLTNKINYFCENTDHELYLVTSEQKGNAPCYELNDKLNWIDLRVDYERSLSYSHYKNLFKLPRHIRKLKQIIERVQPDVIIQCNYAWDFYFLPFIAKKVPKIKEFHSSRFFDAKRIESNGRSLRDKINHWIESRFDGLVALNKDEANFFNSDNVFVIPNSISFYPKIKADLNNKIAITAGRVAPVKGYDGLIEAWKYVAPIFPDWQLHIYGEGESEYMSLLEEQIKSLQLETSVFLMGGTKELQQKMVDSSLYVLSSKTECFPMVLLEAMSCGLPVVSYDCPCGPRNIVSDQADGILVENGEVDSLSDAIVRLIRDHDYRYVLGQMARENILRFDKKVIMSKWEQLFNKLQ